VFNQKESLISLVTLKALVNFADAEIALARLAIMLAFRIDTG
jgi:hypothetical protein